MLCLLHTYQVGAHKLYSFVKTTYAHVRTHTPAQSRRLDNNFYRALINLGWFFLRSGTLSHTHTRAHNVCVWCYATKRVRRILKYIELIARGVNSISYQITAGIWPSLIFFIMCALQHCVFWFTSSSISCAILSFMQFFMSLYLFFPRYAPFSFRIFYFMLNFISSFVFFMFCLLEIWVYLFCLLCFNILV